MNQNATETLNELKKFVAQQASEDASLPAGEKAHQTQVVKDVLSDQVANPKTLKKLIDKYIAGCKLGAGQVGKKAHAGLTN